MAKLSNQQLIIKARKAARSAHSPYSKFPVGAIVETKNGKLFTGCNIENASSGLGICAERTAIFKAVSEGHKEIRRIAVTCPKGSLKNPETLMPCGACRQAMAEFMPPDAEITVDRLKTFQLKDILPSPFKLSKS